MVHVVQMLKLGSLVQPHQLHNQAELIVKVAKIVKLHKLHNLS